MCYIEIIQLLTLNHIHGITFWLLMASHLLLPPLHSRHVVQRLRLCVRMFPPSPHKNSQYRSLAGSTSLNTPRGVGVVKGIIVWLPTDNLTVRVFCVAAIEDLTEVEMGIDVATWRARIGLNYCHQSRYVCRPLPVQWRAARWGVGEVMNSTPLLLQGCMAVVSLTLILGCTFLGRPIGKCGCGKVCRPKLRVGYVPSHEEITGMADTGNIGVCLLLGVCAVVLALLLMAGDVERNPGPTGKEGI